MSEDNIIKVISVAVLMVAVMIHEIAHGYVALLCGDSTARDAGRLSLNPIRHIDLVGTIILPVLLAVTGSGVMFGWAKPVPVNVGRCRNPRQAFWLTAIAGPLSNLIQALLGVGLYYIFYAAIGHFGMSTPMKYGLISSLIYIYTNIVLMTFNLIPIPPLDGSRVLAILLPEKLAIPYMRLEQVGFILIFVLLKYDAFDNLLDGVLKGFLRLFGIDLG